jgi:hypothetical protein
MVMMKCIELNRQNFDEFLEKYRCGEFGDKPIGQAIDKHFCLVGQTYLYYEKNEERAIKYVEENFIFQTESLVV